MRSLRTVIEERTPTSRWVRSIHSWSTRRSEKIRSALSMHLLRAAHSDEGQYFGLRQSFDRGSVAVALNAPVAVGGRSTWSWWDVDPHGGATVGRSTGGEGDDLAEMAFIVSSAKFVVSWIQMLSACKNGTTGKCVCAAITAAVDAFGMGLAYGAAYEAASKGLWGCRQGSMSSRLGTRGLDRRAARSPNIKRA